MDMDLRRECNIAKEKINTDISALVPVLDSEYESVEGLITVSYVKKKLNFIEKTFYKKLASKPYKIDLDEIGSFVWLQIDGKRTVAEIAEIAKAELGDKVNPADERVALFIKQLAKSKLVVLYKKEIG